MRTILFTTIFLLSLAVVVTGQSEVRVLRTWEVIKYDLDVTLPATEAERFLASTARLELKNASNGNVSSLTMRISPNAEVSAVKLNGATADFSKGEEKIGGGSLQRIIVRGVGAAPGTLVKVEVAYRLKVVENNGVGALSSVGSQFLPLSFWYPTPNSWFFARGADFAPVRLKVNGKGTMSVMSAGAQNGDTFDLALNGQPFFVTGDWDEVADGTVKVYVPAGSTADDKMRAAELARLTGEAKAFVAGVLGDAPDVPVRLVAVRRGSGFTSGGTTLFDEAVLRRPRIDALTTVTIVESLARIWLGGSTRIEGDGAGVIREGLSRYLATQFIERKFGKEIADVERQRQRTAYAAVSRRDSALSLMSPLDDYYYTANTNKGAMIWRLLAAKAGPDAFARGLKSVLSDKFVDLAEVRSAFGAQKELLDFQLDQLTEMNLMVGLPVVNGNETRVNLRNTGAIDADVEVVATTADGKRLSQRVLIPKQNFGSVSFKSDSPLVRTEIDAEKYFPQTDYSDDFAPRQIDESDLLLYVKKPFDKQDFATAEKNARLVLSVVPRFDEVRVLLGRIFLAENKNSDAEREFKTVLEEPLPTARGLGWALVGMGEVMARSGRATDALGFYDRAVRADAEYGATLAARQGREKLNVTGTIDESVRQFFTNFDKAAISNVKSNVEALILAGEVPRFAGGIAGQAQLWTSRVTRVDRFGPNSVIVEVSVELRMINKEPERGTAVFRLHSVGSNWRLSGVEVFEVR